MLHILILENVVAPQKAVFFKSTDLLLHLNLLPPHIKSMINFNMGVIYMSCLILYRQYTSVAKKGYYFL